MTTSPEDAAARASLPRPRPSCGRSARRAFGTLLVTGAIALAAHAGEPGDPAFNALLAAVEAPTLRETAREPDDGDGPRSLGGGWTLDVGGQVRLRSMNERNKSLTNSSPRRNDYNLVRTLIHADFRHEDGFRAYIEAIDARIHGEDRPPTPIDRNPLDVRNAFIEYDAGLPTWRLGRMDLKEGAQRIISPLDWGNTRRAFEGGFVRLDHSEGTHTDIFVTQPVAVDPHHTDHRTSGLWFSGVYHTAHVDGGTGEYDLFALSLNQNDDVLTSEDGDPGDGTRYTVGGRWRDRYAGLGYEFWGAYQFGDHAGDDIDAHAWSVRLDKPFPEADGAPVIGLDVDYASGDSDSTDGRNETFNQLFPLGHAYFGYLDLVGRQNIFDVSPYVSVGVAERTRFRAAFHDFQLAEDSDALYNAGGAASFNDPSGGASTDVGTEIDLTLTHVPEWLDRRTAILVGWSKFYAGSHEEDLGGAGDAELFYVQLTLSF